jgi:uracil-DNA glycosylase
MVAKKEALSRLAQKRKTDVWPGYFSIADFHGGIYECDYVSPYTKTAGNLNADVFVMLQDWSSTDSLNGPICHDSIKYGHTVAKFTNSNLKELLQQHFGIKLSQTYGTNLFPFIKPGPMNAGIPQRLMDRAAIEYGLPQIEIIKPKLVICFGKSTFNALRTSAGIPKVSSVDEGIERPFKVGDTSVWLQAHTGMLGQNNRNRGGVNRVDADWRKMVRSVST